MIQMLIGPVAKIASTWMEGRVKKTEAVTRMKVAKAEAEATVMEKKATGEISIVIIWRRRACIKFF